MKGNKLTAHLYGLDSWLPSGADRQEQLGSFEYTGSEPQPQSFWLNTSGASIWGSASLSVSVIR